MSRCSREHRVHFIEESISDADEPWLELLEVTPTLTRVVPQVCDKRREEHDKIVRALLSGLCSERNIEDPLHWYYTPTMWSFGKALPRSLVVYDCMDELANFLDPPAGLLEQERDLLAQADVVFAGGMALYEAKRDKHPNVHAVPSSVDVPFFMQAREVHEEPEDQAAIPAPRIGYCGVIDERIDLDLIAHLARARADRHIVMLGPVAKIDESALPRLPNIHYLGQKVYSELPRYLAGWQVALMPFALNDATRFISPTKTPEYLAAGLPVVSTAIRDVVEPYERLGLVRIARSPDELVGKVDAALTERAAEEAATRDAFLAENSWDRTWARMQRLVQAAQASRRSQTPASVTPGSVEGSVHV